MAERNLFVSLDVGTTKVCTIIGEKTVRGIEILGIGSHPSHGLKKGSVVNIEKTVSSIRGSIEEAKLMAGIDDIHSATIGIAGNHIYCFNSTGVSSVRGTEITEEDISRAIESAKAVVIPSDREILHIIPQEYCVDNTRGIFDPIGMCGKRLEVHVHIVTGLTPLIHNLVKCVEYAGLKTNKIVLQPLASSKSVLTMEEMELGVVLVDIGGGTTDIAVWKDGSLIHSEIIPVGGNHFTHDLASLMKIPHKEAERIKINHGQVISEGINPSAQVQVQGLTGSVPREVKLLNIAQILEARAEELCLTIKNILKERNLEKKIIGGVVFTGGGSLLKGFAELAAYTLEQPTKIGIPKSFGGMSNIMQNPQFSTVVGLLLESDDFLEGPVSEEVKVQKENDLMGKFGASFKNVFKEIF